MKGFHFFDNVICHLMPIKQFHVTIITKIGEQKTINLCPIPCS